MPASEIITDPLLRSALSALSSARDECTSMLDFLDAHPLPSPSATADPSAASAELELELSRRQKRLNAHLAAVRHLNRTAVMGVRATKQSTAEARAEIDALHLALQNLYYEQRHLRGEIAACEGYAHGYADLPMVPEAEFLAEFPEHSGADEDALMVARIGHELTERRALEERRQALLRRKQGLIAENKKRKEDLENLDKDLEKFIEAATPIVKTFEKEY